MVRLEVRWRGWQVGRWLGSAEVGSGKIRSEVEMLAGGKVVGKC